MGSGTRTAEREGYVRRLVTDFDVTHVNYPMTHNEVSRDNRNGRAVNSYVSSSQAAGRTRSPSSRNGLRFCLTRDGCEPSLLTLLLETNGQHVKATPQRQRDGAVQHSILCQAHAVREHRHEVACQQVPGNTRTRSPSERVLSVASVSSTRVDGYLQVFGVPSTKHVQQVHGRPSRSGLTSFPGSQ
jgi:hypothetical protein